MSARELPARPNLEQYQKQAKDLVKGWKSHDPEVLLRVKQHHPRLRFSDSEHAKFALADAQLVIAREHGFASWANSRDKEQGGTIHRRHASADARARDV